MLCARIYAAEVLKKMPTIKCMAVLCVAGNKGDNRVINHPAWSITAQWKVLES